MCNIIVFFGSLDRKTNDLAISFLTKLEDVEIIFAGSYPFLNQQLDMPYIYTDEGSRYYGLKDIENFVNNRKEIPKN